MTHVKAFFLLFWAAGPAGAQTPPSEAELKRCVAVFYEKDAKKDGEVIDCFSRILEEAKVYAQAARDPEPAAEYRNRMVQAQFYRGLANARHKHSLDPYLDPAPVDAENRPRGPAAALADLREVAASEEAKRWIEADRVWLDNAIRALRVRLALQNLEAARGYSATKKTKVTEKGFWGSVTLATGHWDSVRARVARFLKEDADLFDHAELRKALDAISENAKDRPMDCSAGDSYCGELEDARLDVIGMIESRSLGADLPALRVALRRSRGQGENAAERFQLSLDRWKLVKEGLRGVLADSPDPYNDPRAARLFDAILAEAEAGGRECAPADPRCREDEEARRRVVEGLTILKNSPR